MPNFERATDTVETDHVEFDLPDTSPQDALEGEIDYDFESMIGDDNAGDDDSQFPGDDLDDEYGDVDEGDEPDSADETSDDENAADEAEKTTSSEIPRDVWIRAGQLGIDPEKVEKYARAGLDVVNDYLDEVAERKQAGQDDRSPSDVSSDFKVEAYNLDFEGENAPDLDDDVKTVLSGMNQHYHAQVQKTMNTSIALVREMLDLQQERAQVEVNDLIDDLANDRSADFKQILGAGESDNTISDRQAKNRDLVFDEVNSIMNARRDKGLPPISMRRAFSEAVKAVTGKPLQDKQTKTAQKLESRKRISSPKTRGKVPDQKHRMSRRERAELALKEKYGDKLSD